METLKKGNLLALCLLLGACTQAGPADLAAVAPAPGSVATPTTAEAPAPVQAGPLPITPVDLSGLSSLTVDQVEQYHAQALSAGRLHSPPGNNVVELELALRHLLGDEGRKRYQPMLNDMAPNLMLLAEFAISQGNLAERDRLVNLMEAIDPTLPSLSRLRSATLADQGQDAPLGDAIVDPAAAGQGQEAPAVSE